MKTLIFDTQLTLRGISERADSQAALLDLDATGCIDRGTESIEIDDWNFIRVPEYVASALRKWQALGSPAHVSPFKDIAAWNRYLSAGRDRAAEAISSSPSHPPLAID